MSTVESFQNAEVAPMSAIAEFKKKAAAAYQGPPVFGSESWKYTNPAPIFAAAYSTAVPAGDSFPVGSPHQGKLERGCSAVVRVVDGASFEVQTSAELPRGVQVTSLAKAAPQLCQQVERAVGLRRNFSDVESFVALNGGSFTDVVVVMVPAGTVLGAPILISHLCSNGTASYPRTVVIVGENASVAIVEQYQSAAPGNSLSVACTELQIGKGAHCSYTKVQQLNAASYHLGDVFAAVAQDATVELFCANTGGAIVRNEIGARFDGSNATVLLNGITIADGTQQIDNATFLDHALPHCQSSELFKGVYAGNAEGVFTGTIIVRQDAQKTNAFQRNQAILLSPTAKINTRPQLKIFADDVKCTHGATVGELDPESKFYLTSRGISGGAAQAILARAFLGETVALVKQPVVKEFLAELVEQQLAVVLERV